MTRTMSRSGAYFAASRFYILNILVPAIVFKSATGSAPIAIPLRDDMSAGFSFVEFSLAVEH